MREFTRLGLRILMILFLFVGCAHNVYHLQKMIDNSKYSSYHRRYNPSYNSRYSSTRTQQYDNDEEIEDIGEVVVLPEHDEYDY